MHQSIPSILSALSRMNQMMDLYSTKNTSRAIYQRLERTNGRSKCYGAAYVQRILIFRDADYEGVSRTVEYLHER